MKGFISYAHADWDACDQFCKTLTPAARQFGIEFWTDWKIHTGQDWKQTIADAVAAADVFVALVSVESLYSSYISDYELPAMQARSQATGALILPVVLNRCLWEYRFAATQVAPTQRGRVAPIYDWKPKQNGFHAAAQQAANSMRLYYSLSMKGTP